MTISDTGRRPPTARERLQMVAAEFLGTGLVRLLALTLRWEIHGVGPVQALRESGGPVIFVTWHSRLLPLIYLHRDQQIAALVSEHRDGEYIARVLGRLGFRMVRGSSSRGGGRALRELVQASRSGHDLAITPDGPRGPARTLKGGALTVARLTGASIVPLSAGGLRVWRASSWDRFMVPKPFARIQVRYGVPVSVSRTASSDELEQQRLRIEAELNRLTDEVDATGFSAESGNQTREVAP